ncbi:hypothetical protein CQW23_08351 [Capsicum baccatum]|uniref:Uncharacterized protein n=1 Tax=Capsicum baccatum TaxID=33114 RepID=A0A2G2X8X1_CAPBA|nr:hypothetical protein CQW23_08351 [Capsicum baccatum]
MQILLAFLQYSPYGVKATSLGPKKRLLGILDIGVFVICEAASDDDAIKTGTLPNSLDHETPLYLASESGFHGALINILISCKKPTYAAGPSNRTLLHAAVIQEHKGLEKKDGMGTKRHLKWGGTYMFGIDSNNEDQLMPQFLLTGQY